MTMAVFGKKALENKIEEYESIIIPEDIRVVRETLNRSISIKLFQKCKKLHII